MEPKSVVSPGRRRGGIIAAVAVLIVLGLVLWQTWEYWLPQEIKAPAMSSGDGGPPGGMGGGARGGPPGGFPGAAEMRRRLQDDVKRALEVNDEAWEKLRPKVERVTQLQEQLRPAPPGLMPPGGASGTSELAETREMLRAAVDDAQTTPEALAANLSAARAARRKLEAELKTAQDDLRKELTARQEAALAALGVLD